jgi:hypothetical protein
MRKIVVFGTVLACALVAGWAQSGKEEKAETLLRWQFAGTKQIANVKDLKTFREIFALPETAALREAAAQHFAVQAARRFTKGGDTNAHAAIIRLIQPLLPDLWLNESSFLMTARGAQDTDWMLGLKLDANRSAEWGKALSQLATSAGMQPGAGETWTAQKDNYRLSFSRAKDWTVIEGGHGGAEAKMARDFRSDLGKRRPKELLEADVNSPLLGKIWNSETLAHAPKLVLRAEPKGDGIRSELTMEYPQDLGIKAEKWNVPTGLIQEPLIGFTAIQGVEKKLGMNEKFKALGAQQTPNQLFVWSIAHNPFMIYLAGEVKNSAEVVTNAARALKDAKLPTGSLALSTNRPVLIWNGLPVKPFFEMAAEPHASFVRAGLFPVHAMNNKPAPPELFAQLKKRNQIYYEWEVTGVRLSKFSPLWQLYYLISQQVTRNDAPSEKWIQAAEKYLGNTVTEGTLENSRRIKLVRQSQIGLNSVELLLLAHLVDDADVFQGRPEAKAKALPPAPVPR